MSTTETGYDMGGRWAAELFPQHTKHSGAAALLAAADAARNDMQHLLTAERDRAVLAELDEIDRADEWAST